MNSVIKKTYFSIFVVLLFSAVMCLNVFTFPVRAASGKTFYVAANGKDDNDGLSPGSPLSFRMASATVLSGGDSILFRRGDTFYGSFQPLTYNTSNSSRVTAGAYGSGEMPTLSLAKIVSKNWIKVAGGFYRYNLGTSGSYGGVQDSNTDVGFVEDADGKKWGVRRVNASACVNQYDFYCDNSYIYMKSSEDPYQKLGKMTMGVDGVIIRVTSNMNIQDLRLKYSAGHGINLQKEGYSNITVSGCVIEDIGGAQLGTSGFTKYGNGIELYGSASNVTVKQNIIRNTYDVGFTCQGGGSCSWKDIVVENNIFSYNTQSIEIWTSGTTAGMGIDGLYFKNNVCINQGEGWGTPARPDLVGGGGQVKMTDVLVYGYEAPVLKYSITGNTFYNANETNRVYSVATVGSAFFGHTQIDKNYIYLPSAASICMSTDKTGGTYGNKFLSFSAWQAQFNQDKNSTFTAIGSNRSKYASMENLSFTSDNFNEILSAVKAAGIKTNAVAMPTSSGKTDAITSTTKKPTTNTTKKNNNSQNQSSSASGTGTGKETDSTSEITNASITDNTQASDSTSVTGSNTTKTEPAGSVPGNYMFLILIAVVIVVAGAVAAVYFLVIKKKRA